MTRLKRIIKRTAIGLVTFVAVLLIVNAILVWRASRRLEEGLAAIRADGQPTCIADLAPRPIPNDQNAAAILAGIHDDLLEFTVKYCEFEDSPLGLARYESIDKGEQFTSEQKAAMAAMAAIVDSFPRISTEIDRAAACEQYASQLDFSHGSDVFQEQVLEASQPFRSVARFLDWRNTLLLAEGKHEEALKESMKLLRLARLSENEPTLLLYLLANSNRGAAASGIRRALQAGPISAELHASLDEELARHDDPQRMVHALRTERAYEITASANWQFGAPSFLIWPMKNMRRGILDVFEEQIPIADQPWHEISSTFNSKIDTETDLMIDTGTISITGVFDTARIGAAILLPGVEASHEVTSRNNAQLRCLRVLNAMQAIEMETGQEVASLDDLGLPKTAILDPFSGKQLHLKRTDLGPVIYSVGRDEIDDGGDLRRLRDLGVAPVGYEMHGP